MFYDIIITYKNDGYGGTDERPDRTVSHRQPATTKNTFLIYLIVLGTRPSLMLHVL